MPAAKLVDSSGLSTEDRLTARILDEVVNIAAGNTETGRAAAGATCCPSRAAAAPCPTATSTPTPGATPRAGLRAKTGSLTGTNALAGIVTDDNGRVLTFALDLQQRRAHRRAPRSTSWPRCCGRADAAT